MRPRACILYFDHCDSHVNLTSRNVSASLSMSWFVVTRFTKSTLLLCFFGATQYIYFYTGLLIVIGVPNTCWTATRHPTHPSCGPLRVNFRKEVLVFVWLFSTTVYFEEKKCTLAPAGWLPYPSKLRTCAAHTGRLQGSLARVGVWKRRRRQPNCNEFNNQCKQINCTVKKDTPRNVPG